MLFSNNTIVLDKKAKLSYIVALFILFSLCYEKTIFTIFNSTLIDPRLYDIGFFMALILLPSLLKIPSAKIYILPNPKPPLFAILTTFFFATLFTIFIIYPDPSLYRYSIVFFFRYLQIAIILTFFYKAQFSSRQWNKLIFAIIVFSFLPISYAYGQIFGLISRIRDINGLTSGDTKIYSDEFLQVTSTLGYHYGHLSNFATIIALIITSFYISSKNKIYKFIYLLYMFIVIAVPPLTSSRGGFLIPFIYFGNAMLYYYIWGNAKSNSRIRNRLILKYIFIILMPLILIIILGQYLSSHSTKLGYIRSLDIFLPPEERGMGGSGADPIGRAMAGPDWVSSQLNYKNSISRLFLGDGFYCRELDDKYGKRYAAGFGLHSSLFFPWEQAGILSFIFVIWLIVRIIRIGPNIIKKFSIDEQWKMAIMISLIPSAFIGNLGSGQDFLWPSSAALTGTTFVLLIGLVIPYKLTLTLEKERILIQKQIYLRRKTFNGIVKY